MAFGSRSAYSKSPTRAIIDQHESTQSNAKVRPLRIADSDLIVTKAWLLGSDVEGYARECGGRVRFVKQDWSQNILERCLDGDIDLAIYNSEASLAFYKSLTDPNITVSPSVFRSMSGRNFAMIVSKENPLLNIPHNELKENLNGSTIYVGKDTDRYQNLETVFDITEDWWSTNNVRIVNIPDARLEIIETEPHAIIVPGQNRRFEAHMSDDYEELVSYETLDPSACRTLRARSSNSLIVGSNFPDGYKSEESIIQTLKRRFRQNTVCDDFLQYLIEELVDSCEFTMRSRQDRFRITNHVLYETFGLGSPEW